jgi:hypothetical protein
MRIAVHDNRGNGSRLFVALQRAGHELVYGQGDVLLTDYDDGKEYVPLCDRHPRGVFLHPHGAGLVGWGDGEWLAHPHTRGQFVHGEGQVEVLRRAGYPRRAVAVGWSFCDLNEPHGWATDVPTRVLFAPGHAMNNGWISPWLPMVNARLFRLLTQLPITLTVRTVGPFAPLGLPVLPALPSTGVGQVTVQHVPGDGTVPGAVRAIDAADVVVAAMGTFACLSVARGVPTVMYDQTPQETCGNQRHPAESWPLYADYAWWPYDIDGADTVDAVRMALLRARDWELPALLWRERFIGPQMDPAAFVKQFERAVETW